MEFTGYFRNSKGPQIFQHTESIYTNNVQSRLRKVQRSFIYKQDTVEEIISRLFNIFTTLM